MTCSRRPCGASYGMIKGSLTGPQLWFVGKVRAKPASSRGQRYRRHAAPPSGRSSISVGTVSEDAHDWALQLVTFTLKHANCTQPDRHCLCTDTKSQSKKT